MKLIVTQVWWIMITFHTECECVKTEELFAFWSQNLTSTKTWTGTVLPKESNAVWSLGLGGLLNTGIHKQKTGKLEIADRSRLILNYFSVVTIADESSIKLTNGSTIELYDQSELTTRETSSITVAGESKISMHSSKLTPGVLQLDSQAALILNEARFYGLLTLTKLGPQSVLKAESRSQVVFIGGSKFELGARSTMSIFRSFLEIAADITVGQKCNFTFFGLDMTMVGGTLDVKNNVEFKAESKTAFTVFGASLLFTEGSKITMDVQSEFNLERNSSLFMARRDLRLKIEEKALLKFAQNAHCLMTDDLTVEKQKMVVFSFNATNVRSSVRCFPTYNQLLEEKRLHFPGN